MPADQGERGTLGRGLMDVLQYQGTPGGKANPQVASKLCVELRPAEHRSWLLLHQLERGLPGIGVQAVRCRGQREKESRWIAVFWSQAQPERMPAHSAERQGQPLGERVFGRRLDEGNAAASRFFERGVNRVRITRQRRHRFRFERHASSPQALPRKACTDARASRFCHSASTEVFIRIRRIPYSLKDRKSTRLNSSHPSISY